MDAYGLWLKDIKGAWYGLILPIYPVDFMMMSTPFGYYPQSNIAGKPPNEMEVFGGLSGKLI